MFKSKPNPMIDLFKEGQINARDFAIAVCDSVISNMEKKNLNICPKEVITVMRDTIANMAILK